MKKEASQQFWDSLSWSSSMVIDCTFCCRVHFCIHEDAGDWEQGELERLLKNQNNPNGQYIGHTDLVPWANLFGGQLVRGCPCGKECEFEKMILNNKNFIIKFLKTHVKEEKRRVDDLETRMKGL